MDTVTPEQDLISRFGLGLQEWVAQEIADRLDEGDGPEARAEVYRQLLAIAETVVPLATEAATHWVKEFSCAWEPEEWQDWDATWWYTQGKQQLPPDLDEEHQAAWECFNTLFRGETERLAERQEEERESERAKTRAALRDLTDPTTISQRVSAALRLEYERDPMRHNDPGVALANARAIASSMVPAGITGIFDDQGLTFTVEDGSR